VKLDPHQERLNAQALADQPYRSDLSEMERPAGFWFRFAALCLDFFLIAALVEIAVTVARHCQIYIPREASWLLLGVSCAVGMIGWRGATLGKTLCGLRVCRDGAESIGFGRVLMRETVAKAISAAPMLLGFLWAAGRKKRAWHDWMSGTRVLINAGVKWRQSIITLVLIGDGIILLWYVWEPWISYCDTLAMAPPTNLVLPYETRDPSVFVEAASMKPGDVARCSQWLDEHGKMPLEYLVDKAKEHQVVLLGEMHEQGDTLRWFNEAIPSLYSRAGVTCIGMEVCLASDIEAIQRLVTAPTFDPQLAMQIARHQFWGIWGFKEYWDVFKTVWKVNRTIPAGQRKLRLIGLDKSFDAMFVMALGIDGPARDAPLEEKLRVWKAPKLIALLMLRDGVMARQIENEVFNKGERAVVLIGSEHANLGYKGRGWGQMGLMLHARHPHDLFTIRLHQMDISASEFDKTYEGPSPAMAALLERIMARREKKPVGFDLAGSPMAMIRDSACAPYCHEAGLALGDIAGGYVYLKDWRTIRRCCWLSGFISDEMFIENKPLYQAIAKRGGATASNADMMNAFFAEMK
jgi:uncharacterized RDD family membrane protein YckC